MNRTQRSVVAGDSVNLPRWQAALNRALSGGTIARCLFIGDSVTAGYNTTSVVTDRIAQAVQSAVGSTTEWSGKVQQGWDRFYNNNTNPRWSIGAGWTAFSCNWGAAGMVYCNNITTTLSWGPYDCDGFRIMYLKATTTFVGTANAIDVNIDGGSTLTTLDCSGTKSINVATVSASSFGSHTLNMVARNPGKGFIVAVEPIVNAAKIAFCNGGIPSSATGGWANDATGFGLPEFTGVKTAVAATPDLTVVNLGLNDQNTGVSQSTYRTNLRTIIATLQAASSDVLLVYPNQNTLSNTSNMTFIRAEIKDAAKDYGCSLVDLYQYGAVGGDGTHPGTSFMTGKWAPDVRTIIGL